MYSLIALLNLAKNIYTTNLIVSIMRNFDITL